MRRRRWRALAGGRLARLAPPTIAFGPAPELSDASHAVGFLVRSLEVEDHRGARVEVGLAVWYPTVAVPAPHSYELGDNELVSELAVDGRAAPGPFPLVLFSHGATGTGLNALFLTERLAARGFVVAALDFADPFFAARILGAQPRAGFLRTLEMARWVKDLRDRQLDEGGRAYRRAHLGYRPRSARLALDRVIAEGRDPASPLLGAIDGDHVGLLGHSFGAWNSLLLAGADPLYADSRVRAVACLSAPSGAGVFEPGELEGIEVPSMFLYGGEEPRLGRQSDRANYFDRARPPKILVEVEGADHFTFSGGIRHEFPRVSDYLARDSRRATVARYVDAFFDRYLRDDPGSAQVLATRGVGVSSFACDLSSEPSAH